MSDLDGIWRADPTHLAAPHRYADFFIDVPLLPEGQAVYLDAEQRNRLALHAEAVGLRKSAPAAVKYWAPPRGTHMPGNCGMWVPVGLEDPAELTTPDPAAMTPHERDELRRQLAAFDAADYPTTE